MHAPSARSSADLLAAVDSLISKHGQTHPELVRDLIHLRSQIESAERKGSTIEVAGLALRVATWAKFFYELFLRE